MNGNSIFRFLAPKDNRFFVLFDQTTQNLLQAAEVLQKMLGSANPADREALSRKIKDLEHTGDDLTHQIFNTLNTSFITPFDREDIHELTTSIDDVLDYIDASANAIFLFKIDTIGPEIKQLGDLILKVCKELEVAVKQLRHMKNPQSIIDRTIAINGLENDADIVFNNSMARLFAETKDAIEVIKRKEILQLLEIATDKAEDASNVMKAIVVKAF